MPVNVYRYDGSAWHKKQPTPGPVTPPQWRPIVFHYSYVTPPRTDYTAGTMLVVSIFGARKWATQIQQLRNNDVEVLEYTLPCHDYPDSSTDSVEQTLFYTGGSGTTYNRSDIPASWYFDPSNPDRVSVPTYGGRVMDLRANSAFLNHLLTNYYPTRLASSVWKMDGFFLDVLGDGYTGWFTGATSDEITQIQAGMQWFMTQIRSISGNDCILINNNSWNNTNNDTDGIVIENHSGVEIGNAFWKIKLSQVTRTAHRRNATINTSYSDALAWSTVPGVDLSGFSNGNYIIGPATTGTGWAANSGHIHLWDSTTV